MGRRHWVRTTKCQLLVTSLCVMLLGLAVTILTIITRYGAHFSIISGVSYEANPYRIFHNVAFYSGICLSMILVLAALLSTVATVRESVCLMAMGFFCFAIVFCALIQAAFWRYTNNSEVEDAMMDVYDSVYEEVRRNLSSFRRQELATIHETFLCCGKQSPFGETGGIENETCPSEHMGTAREDCLQEIQDFLKKHMDFVSALLILTICFMETLSQKIFILVKIFQCFEGKTKIILVYGMILTSFLWFSIHFSNNLDRRGKYIFRET
ncbi:tetraspanin-32 isoform X1 [Mauremys reevesii]|uniref:tetraspanin-32 isoform X1 n=2 Tax=Mauremys reevesii TaxID=260615 RepID=UPI00194015BB|nr:tetraspanin-32 isoform X1 [Mauremys reevesii]XP_039392445.1 tetraspanin-32 isoform X1 [Mauremys reevesii]XP_039392446.1 tetraspanin-32 isoform X1 [Mauremys reevesii]